MATFYADVSADVEIDPADVMDHFTQHEKQDLFNRLVKAGYENDHFFDETLDPEFQLPVKTLDDEFKVEVLQDAFKKYTSWELEERLK
jgi:hypothetical protein